MMLQARFVQLGSSRRFELERQAMLVGYAGLGLALGRLHLLEVGGNRFDSRRPFVAADFLHRLDAGAIGFEFDNFA